MAKIRLSWRLKMEQIPFDGELWRLEVQGFDLYKNPELPQEFTERNIKLMLEITANMPKEQALSEIEKIRAIISEKPETRGLFSQLAVPKIQANINASAKVLTCILKKSFSTQDDPNILLDNALKSLNQNELEKTLEYVGQAGALMLEGKKVHPKIEEKILASPLRQYYRGLTTLTYLNLANDIRIEEKLGE